MPFKKTRGENECSICGCVKSPEDFYLITKRGKQKRSERCRECSKKLSVADREKRKLKIKAKAIENKESIALYQKEYRLKNKERLSAFYKVRYEQRKKAGDSFRKERNARAFKYRQDPKIRIKECLKSRLSSVFLERKIRRLSKLNSLIGCSWGELKSHIESKFKRGMTWENRGTHWHVDHILPCASFDHSDEKQIRQCWHFTNLRPMWAKQNLQKGAKISTPQMSLLL